MCQKKVGKMGYTTEHLSCGGNNVLGPQHPPVIYANNKVVSEHDKLILPTTLVVKWRGASAQYDTHIKFNMGNTQEDGAYPYLKGVKPYGGLGVAFYIEWNTGTNDLRIATTARRGVTLGVQSNGGLVLSTGKDIDIKLHLHLHWGVSNDVTIANYTCITPPRAIPWTPQGAVASATIMTDPDAIFRAQHQNRTMITYK